MPVTYSEVAKRENVWLRMFLMAPTGAGKTKGALEVGTKLFGGSLPVSVLDTQHGQAKLYGDQYKFAHYEMTGDFSPEEYIDVIDTVEERTPGGVLIIDSITHEWNGKGGVLQLADRFGDWKNIRPRHSTFIERILASQLHVIACCRAKMKYEVGENEVNGRVKQTITKLGIGPIQDDTLPYEFDVAASIDAASHLATFTNRCEPLVDTTRSLVPGDEVAEILTKWLSEGEPPAPPVAAEPELVENLVKMLLTEGHDAVAIEERFVVVRRQNRGVLPPEYIAEATAKAIHRRDAAAPADA